MRANRIALISFLLLFSLTACAGLATSEPKVPPTDIPQPSESSVPQATATNTEEVLPTEEIPTASATSVPPTETPEPSATDVPTQEASPEEPTEEPTETATATRPAFEPKDEFGAPSLMDTFSSGSNWEDSGGDLPDTDFIRFALGTNQMLVTGKPANFDTWWFTWPRAGDQFIEMKVELDTCSGKQAYGLMLRGPESATAATGYIFTFSCDGSYRLRRLDSTDPYSFEELIPWKESDFINAGKDQKNTMGVRMIGRRITLFANGQVLETVRDGTFDEGRLGIFVNAGAPGDFTFRMTELSYWNLD